MTRADRLTLVRQLAADGLSQRAIAKRLKVSKDTVRRDLAQIAARAKPGDAPGDAPANRDEPQVSAAGAEEHAPVDEPTPEPLTEPDAPMAEPDDEPSGELTSPVALLPRRVAHPRLEIDLHQWPAMRRDLAVLRQSGRTVEELVSQAVVVLAFGYRQALDRGELLPGESFTVTGLTVRRALRAEAAIPRRP